MFEMLSEIFAAPGDRARGLTILISSLVAIGIFVASQNRIDRRDKRELRIKKIEELYLALNHYRGAADSFIQARFDHQSNFLTPEQRIIRKKIYNEFVESSGQLQMLIGLYFKNAGFDVVCLERDLYIGVEHNLERLELYHKSKNNIYNTYTKSLTLCEDLMQKFLKQSFLSKIRLFLIAKMRSKPHLNQTQSK